MIITKNMTKKNVLFMEWTTLENVSENNSPAHGQDI